MLKGLCDVDGVVPSGALDWLIKYFVSIKHRESVVYTEVKTAINGPVTRYYILVIDNKLRIV